MSIEDGKDSISTAFPRSSTQSRVFPLRLLQLLVLFLVLGIGFLVLSMYYFGVQNVVNKTRTSFQSCIETSNTLESWVKPPSNLMHKMNDTELFWRATFVPRINKYPFKRVPKVAFMFLTRGPLPLSPLWDRFLEGHDGLFSIYIHTVPNYYGNFSRKSVFYKRQIPSQMTEWGRMSLCDAERRLLANALLDINNERFVLVSESCIPLYNFSIIYHYLMKSMHSFIGAFDDPGPYGRGRYDGNMAPLVGIEQWRKGSQWFEVNRRVAVSIVEDTKFYPKFEQFCRPACYVDEHYFPTMLTIQSPLLIANRTITWVDWSRGGAHPATFSKGDINEDFLKRILEGQNCLYNNQPNTICYLFARKFAASALGPLLEFAPKVPVDLVVDHSVQVDVAGTENAVQANMELEFQRNKERFAFLKWGSTTFQNMLVVPPGSGIVHQVNLEYLGRVVFNTDGTLYPDSVVGTNSHTTMIDGLGVVGCGVGGIEAEAAMLGQVLNHQVPSHIRF